MLGQDSVDFEGISGSPLAGLLDCDIETYKAQDAGATRQIDRQVDEASDLLVSHGISGAVWDPSRDKDRVESLVRYALDEAGAVTPHQMANFVLDITRQAQRIYPNRSPLEASYAYVQGLIAYKAAKEASSV